MEEIEKIDDSKDYTTETDNQTINSQTNKDFSLIHRKKAFRIGILSLLALIFALGFAYYQSYNNLKIKSQTSKTQIKNQILDTTPVPTIDPTLEWKVYRNEKLGFEFRYPTTIADPIRCNTEKTCNFANSVSEKDSNEIYLVTSDGRLSISQTKMYERIQPYGALTTTTLNSYPAYKRISHSTYETIEYFIQRNDDLYKIKLHFLSTNKESQGLLNKIISTLTFTQQDDIVDGCIKDNTTSSQYNTYGWKKYENKKYGFSIKYPLSLIYNDKGSSTSAKFVTESRYKQDEALNDMVKSGDSPGRSGPEGDAIVILVFGNPKSLKLTEWAREYDLYTGFITSRTSECKIKAFKGVNVLSYSGGSMLQTEKVIVLSPDKSYGIIFIEEKSETIDELFPQIISTLEFLN